MCVCDSVSTGGRLAGWLERTRDHFLDSFAFAASIRLCVQLSLGFQRTVLLEDREDLDDDLRRGADKHLALSTALGVDWDVS